jgi:hypothetical protein
MTTTYRVFHQKRQHGDRVNIEFVGTVKVNPLECAFDAAREAYPQVKYPLVQNVNGYKNVGVNDNEYSW